jgi:iron-sulfur cluster repair protein YtfE (RIC family)
MEPSEARRQLLAQHDDLRARLQAARNLRDRVIAGAAFAGELAALLDELRQAYVEHNQLEEVWLEPLLRLGDAWAPQRVARMLEEHEAEHDVFESFFRGSVFEMAEGLDELADDIEAHMAAEERTILHRAVLRDSLVTDGAGG